MSRRYHYTAPGQREARNGLICAAILAGRPATELAAEFDLSVSQIRNLARLQIAIRKPRILPPEACLARQLKQIIDKWDRRFFDDWKELSCTPLP